MTLGHFPGHLIGPDRADRDFVTIEIPRVLRSDGLFGCLIPTLATRDQNLLMVVGLFVDLCDGYAIFKMLPARLGYSFVHISAKVHLCSDRCILSRLFDKYQSQPRPL
jgi:hypothetical protein